MPGTTKIEFFERLPEGSERTPENAVFNGITRNYFDYTPRPRRRTLEDKKRQDSNRLYSRSGNCKYLALDRLCHRELLPID
jgi:hypothetical protein